MKRSRRPSRGRSLVPTVLLGLVLALPLAEVAVRGARLAPDVRFIDVDHDNTVFRRSENPILGFELKPNWRDPDADLVRSYPSTNSHGFRDVERAIEKPPGVRRILLLGASVVEGFGLRDLEDTISRRTEAAFGDGTEVLNFGVSAYCTRAKVELLKTKGLAFDPDVVALVFARTDFDNFNREAFQLGKRDRPAAVEWLFAKSHLFRAVATRWDVLGYRAQVDPTAWNAEAIGDNNVVDGLELFAALAREHEFVPIVAVWPRFTDEGFEDPAPLAGRGDELVVEALCRSVGIPSFRFSTHFAQALAAGREDGPRRRFTLGDRIHPNPDGARVAAAALATEIPRLAAVYATLRPGPRDEAAIEAACRLGITQPGESRRLVNLGNTLLQSGRTREAIDAYASAIADDPRLAEAHHNLGVALRKEGRLEEALMAFAEAGRLDPELPDVPLNFGLTLLRLGRPRDALPALERAVALRPGFAPALEARDAALRAIAAQEPEPAAPETGR